MPSRAQAKRWRALQRRKGRVRYGLFLAEGPHLVEELLASPVVARQVLHDAEAADDPGVARLLERCGERGIPVEEVSRGELAEFADTVTPRGILAVAEIPERATDDLGQGDVLVLDAVQDPGNAGTLLRTAEALGMSGAVSLPGTVDLWNPKTVRASAGSILRVPAVEMEWPELRRWCREESVSIWAADVEGEPVGRAPVIPARVALVLGNETAGVRDEILREADRRVSIAIPGPTDSLNVALAGALLMDRILSSR